MRNVQRKVGGLLVGVGGLSTFVALICCIAPWILGGALVALGLGFVLKNSVLIALAVVGLLVGLTGWRLIKDK